jgi:hypothetical protein
MLGEPNVEDRMNQTRTYIGKPLFRPIKLTGTHTPILFINKSIEIDDIEVQYSFSR